MIFLLIFYQLLPVVTCVGAWVVTEWLVSCLGNSQVITKSCLKFVIPPYQLLLEVTCVGEWVVTEWSVSCLGNSHVITRSS